MIVLSVEEACLLTKYKGLVSNDPDSLTQGVHFLSGIKTWSFVEVEGEVMDGL